MPIPDITVTSDSDSGSLVPLTWPMVSHMSNFTIREAEEIDAPQILALLREMADYVKAPHFTLNEEAVRRDMFGVACHCDLLFCGAISSIDSCGKLSEFVTPVAYVLPWRSTRMPFIRYSVLER